MRLPLMLSIVLAGLLVGCATPGGQIAARAADLTAQTWLAARGVPCLDTPPAPVVSVERAPTVSEVLALVVWAAENKRQADAVQRAATEELAAQAAAAAALPPTHEPAPVYRAPATPPPAQPGQP